MRRNMTLGELIATLERKDPERPIRYDFGYFRPHGFHSWRGDYSELAIGYSADGKDQACGDFLKHLHGCVGQTFVGWKGGNFTMTERTPVWVDNSGEYSKTALVDVRDSGSFLRLVTEVADD